MVFQTLPSKTSAADDCLAAIERVIVRGELAPGDRLPPERTLATMLGRNRLTVRNALGRLADAGLLSVRQGSGYIVQDLSRTAGPSLLPRILEMSAEDDGLYPHLVELLRLRRTLGRALLESIAEQGSDLDLSEFDRAVDALSNGLKADIVTPLSVFELDLCVMRSLLDIADSLTLSLFMNGWIQSIQSSVHLQKVLFARGEILLAGYTLLRMWLVNRNPREIDSMIRQLHEQDRWIMNAFRASSLSGDSLAS